MISLAAKQMALNAHLDEQFLHFILHSCFIIVSTVGWTWWDWSLILWTLSSFSAL